MIRPTDAKSGICRPVVSAWRSMLRRLLSKAMILPHDFLKSGVWDGVGRVVIAAGYGFGGD